MTDVQIETPRMILRRWQEDDADALYRYASDEAVSRMALWPRHTSVDMSREVIEKIFMPNPHLFAIVLRDCDEPVGCIGLVPEGMENYKVHAGEREAGYWIGHPYWRKGLVTEALNALMIYCRDEVKLDSLLITCDARNIGSCRVAEKCGFSRVDKYDNGGVPSCVFRQILRR